MIDRTARRVTAPAALALALGLVLTACADGADDPAGGSPATETTETAGTTDDATSSDDRTATPDDDTRDDAGDDTGDDTDDGRDDASGGPGPEHVTAAGLRAVATAEKHTGGTAYALDDPDRDGTWEVDVAKGDRTVEVEVGAEGREVTRTERDDLDDGDRRALAAATVTLTEAVERTVAKAGGRLDDAELDEEDGRFHWSVTVDRQDAQDVDYRVGTRSGEVTRERDDD